MKLIYLVLILASACALRDEVYLSKGLSPRKQKQKIVSLQKKLEVAEKESAKVQEEVQLLRDEMRAAQITLIRRQAEELEEQLHKWELDPTAAAKRLQIESSTLFLQEREILHNMIQSGPSPTSFEAQVVLDQILRLITNLGDSAHEGHSEER
jgi:hypothetical protein